ncbi:MAG: hypothetical protein ACOC33_03735, partial [bacterium]
ATQESIFKNEQEISNKVDTIIETEIMPLIYDSISKRKWNVIYRIKKEYYQPSYMGIMLLKMKSYGYEVELKDYILDLGSGGSVIEYLLSIRWSVI